MPFKSLSKNNTVIFQNPLFNVYLWLFKQAYFAIKSAHLPQEFT